MVLTKTYLVGLALADAAAKANPLADLEPEAPWQICLHDPIRHASAADFVPSEAVVFDIDMSHAQDFPTMIPNLKKANKTVLCYFNAGAVQSWDADLDSFPEGVKGQTLGGDYTDEWYIDIRDARVLELMKRRLDAAADIGCDGVDPDNVDAWVQSDGEDITGFGLTPEDYASYLEELAEYAHSIETQAGYNLLVGQKNAQSLASRLVSTLDFAVLESCREWEFCGDFQQYVSAGKPVFQIEYPKSILEQGELSQEDEKRYCGGTGHADEGFSKILKRASAQLDGWGQFCGGESFEQETGW